MMRIFVSWSGAPSRKIAELLRDWLPNVVQQADMFVSSQDIAKGARGLEIIGQNLESTNFGLLILTHENVASPWVNFEAGALSKSLTQGHVIPLLCGISEIDLPTSPLRQFQHAKIEAAEMLRVVQHINQSCERPLSEEKITLAFNKWWPDFEIAYKKIDSKSPKPAKEKDTAELSATVLDVLGSIMTDLGTIRRELNQQRALIGRIPSSTREYTFPSLSSGLTIDAGRKLGDILGEGLKVGSDSNDLD